MSLGNRIKEQRKNKGLSQEKVAEFIGVSRQAVTKWETDQSAPSTENLFKLAELFETKVDMLLDSEEEDKESLAEQIYHLYKTEEEKKEKEQMLKRKKNLLGTLSVFVGYLLIYFAGRICSPIKEQTSGLYWLIGNDPKQLTYLYGWLLSRKLFWIAMVVSMVPALFGKRKFAFTTLFGFGVGLLLGELCGHNPPGEGYGHGHYGWAIWGCIFAFSAVMGGILEKITKKRVDLKSKKLWVWAAFFCGGIVLIIFAVRAGMPTSFS